MGEVRRVWIQVWVAVVAAAMFGQGMVPVQPGNGPGAAREWSRCRHGMVQVQPANGPDAASEWSSCSQGMVQVQDVIVP